VKKFVDVIELELGSMTS